MPLLVLYNPVCGSSSGQQITESHVLPFLREHNKIPDKVARTESSGHAGAVVVDFVQQTPPDSEITIVLVSGDGTLHEIVNALYTYASSGEKKAIPQLRLVLIPGGTANALHSSYFPPSAFPDSSTLLSSLHAYLSPSPRLSPLTLTHTTIVPPSSSTTGEQTAIVSAVVTSTSLHASILHDAEELRPTIPSLDRFKVAAEKNATRWYHAHLRLLSAPSESTLGTHAPVPSPILQYDPTKDAFAPIVSSSSERDSSSQVLELEGPFSYMLTTVNVDRLEPTFRISPLHRSHPPLSSQTTDVIVVRPLRDPSLHDESEDARSSFKAKVWGALGGAYQDGAHVKLKYGTGGELTQGGERKAVVECFRVGGWEWIPDTQDEKAHLVCADGTIVTIPIGGKAVSRVAASVEMGFDVVVYA